MARKSRGVVEFDDLAPEAYRDLVRETLATSDYIGVGSPDGNRTLVIYEEDDD